MLPEVSHDQCAFFVLRHLIAVIDSINVKELTFLAVALLHKEDFAQRSNIAHT